MHSLSVGGDVRVKHDEVKVDSLKQYFLRLHHMDDLQLISPQPDRVPSSATAVRPPAATTAAAAAAAATATAAATAAAAARAKVFLDLVSEHLHDGGAPGLVLLDLARQIDAGRDEQHRVELGEARLQKEALEIHDRRRDHGGPELQRLPQPLDKLHEPLPQARQVGQLEAPGRLNLNLPLFHLGRRLRLEVPVRVVHLGLRLEPTLAVRARPEVGRHRSEERGAENLSS